MSLEVKYYIYRNIFSDIWERTTYSVEELHDVGTLSVVVFAPVNF